MKLWLTFILCTMSGRTWLNQHNKTVHWFRWQSAQTGYILPRLISTQIWAAARHKWYVFLSSRFITKAGYIYQIFASGYWYMKDIRHIKSIFAYTKKTAITTTIILTTCTIKLTTRCHHLNCITDFRTDSTCRAYKYQYYTEVQIQTLVFYLFFITWFVMHYFSSVHCTQYIMQL